MQSKRHSVLILGGGGGGRGTRNEDHRNVCDLLDYMGVKCWGLWIRMQSKQSTLGGERGGRRTRNEVYGNAFDL